MIPVQFVVEVERLGQTGPWGYEVKMADRSIAFGWFNETVKTKGQAESAALDAFAEHLQRALREPE